jgi:hypothetical protein
MISEDVNLVGNFTPQVTSSSINDFESLKFFKISIHHSNVPRIIEMISNPSLQRRLKSNLTIEKRMVKLFV